MAKNAQANNKPPSTKQNGKNGVKPTSISITGGGIPKPSTAITKQYVSSTPKQKMSLTTNLRGKLHYKSPAR